MRNMILIYKVCILSLLVAVCLKAEVNVNNTEQLFDLTFDELMSTRVNIGSLLFMSNYDKPAMVTTISSEDIRVTPHRNIYDLLETYIPGALFMSHYDSPTLGVRGIISDRNNKVLILVNGHVANQKARSGAIAELQIWDLSDIDKIEVIRGPGSVTYGPGAIACVINIITKTKATNDASDFKINYIYPYNSKGISTKFSQRITDDISIFGFASIQQTQGYSPENAFSIMYNRWTEEEHKTYNRYQEYLTDYFDEPQIKVHFQLDLFDNTSLWFRYANSGTTTNGAVLKSQYQIGLDGNNHAVMGEYANPLQVRHEHLLVNLNNIIELDDNYSISSKFHFGTENSARTMGWFWMWGPNDAPNQKIYDELVDHKSLRNKYNNFSESELSCDFMLNGIESDDFRFALGTTLSYNKWGAPWFEDANMIRMGDHSNIISGPDSPIYGESLFFGVDSANAIFVGNGWSTFMYSFYGEAELILQKSLTALLSARLDKDSYSDYLFSPRIALIYKINEKSSLKIIAQQSNRMNTAEELFLQNRAGNISAPEKLNTIEMIFSSTYSGNLLIEGSVNYNNIDILSWYDPDRTTRETGNLSMIGIEAEIKYNSSFFAIGLNHSFTHMLNWKLATGIERSGISYSEYKFEYLGNSTLGYGNNLNNWANNSTKLFANINLFEKKLILHINARLLWGFEGAKDGLQLVGQIVEGTSEEQAIGDILDVMSRESFYDYDFRLNASINYNFIPNSTISVLLMNISKIGNNYRYKYEAGNKAESYLFRMNLLEEPLTIGLKLSYEI
ncbi:MAG: TonB-dependent receptor [Desulfobulbaceae bacterium]|nr:TonB-dependent receptor [Desulfobulbaceae bacterium]